MSEKDKKMTPEQPNGNEKEAAKKVAGAAKGEKVKKSKPNVFERAGVTFRSVAGENKKIVWPDATTVIKSTGVVLLVVLVCGLAIYGIDTLLTSGIKGLKMLAMDETTTVVETTVEDVSGDEASSAGEAATSADAATTAENGEESTTAAEETDAPESTTAAEESTTGDVTTTAAESDAATTAE